MRRPPESLALSKSEALKKAILPVRPKHCILCGALHYVYYLKNILCFNNCSIKRYYYFHSSRQEKFLGTVKHPAYFAHPTDFEKIRSDTWELALVVVWFCLGYHRLLALVLFSRFSLIRNPKPYTSLLTSKTADQHL